MATDGKIGLAVLAGDGSQTLRWREQDSNHRSRVAVAVVPRLAMDIRPAGAATVRLIALGRLFSFNDLACAA